MTQVISFIGSLRRGRQRGSRRGEHFAVEAAERIAALERERAFAFRRLNLMRTVADAVAAAEDEECGSPTGSRILRSQLELADGSEAQVGDAPRFASGGSAVCSPVCNAQR